MLRAIADTNVLISALIARNGVCGQLLDAALDGQWQLVASPLLLAELEDVLGREKFNRIAQEEVQSYVADVRSRAEVVPDADQPWPEVSRDPDDDYLAALAATAAVDALVSGDGDLLSITGLVPPVARPADFLAMVQAGRRRLED